MLTKRIFNLSLFHKNLIFKPKPVDRFCHVDTLTDHMKLLIDKDDKRQKFSSSLNDSSSPSTVLNILKCSSEARNLNRSDTVKVLTELVKLCKQNNLKPQALSDKFLKNVCVSISSHVNNLEISEVIRILDHLCELKIASSSRTISDLLHRANILLNKASFEEYNRIMQIVSKMSPTPSTQAMKTSLKKKFIIKLSTEFDKNNFEYLVEAFKFACLYEGDAKILGIITNALLNHNFENRSPNSIVSIMETLCSLDYLPPKYDIILSKTQEALITNIQQISNTDIATIFKMLSFKSKKNFVRGEDLYNKIFFDKAIQKLISTDCDIKEGLHCLRAINYLRHTNKEFLNFLSAEIYTQKEYDQKFIRNEQKLVFAMLEGFANLKYKPMFWDTIFNVLKNKDISNYKMEVLVIAAHHLSCLDCYEPRILEHIFEKYNTFDQKIFVNYCFLKLYQKMKTSTDYNGPLPSQAQIESFERLMQNKYEYPLYACLKEALGGPQYVRTNIRTKLYHQIDHIIAFQPGGEPVAISDIKANSENFFGPFEYLEDLNIPRHCQIIAVLRVPGTWYARNTKQLLGTRAVYIETLETLSCRVAVIPDQVWHFLPNSSKIPFLMRAIKSKLNDGHLSELKI